MKIILMVVCLMLLFTASMGAILSVVKGIEIYRRRNYLVGSLISIILEIIVIQMYSGI